MANRFDLNAHNNQDNSVGNKHQLNRKLYANDTASNNNEELQSKNQDNKASMGDELAKKAAKEALKTKLPSAVVESELADKALDAVLRTSKKRMLLRIIAMLSPLIFFALIALFIVVIANDGGVGLYASGRYYEMPCSEVTVKFVDDQYQPTDVKTYPLEDYVAGVVAGEVGGLQSLEVDKAFAIAARTYFVANRTGCTIESSDKYQVFTETNDKLSLQAANETKGKVILTEDGELYTDIHYDAFACIAEEGNYYVIAQQEQKIPKSFIDSKLDKNNERVAIWFTCNGIEHVKEHEHHGEGMSQYGSLYLAEEGNYNYEDIIKFYLGDDVQISSDYYNIANFELKTTSGAKNVLQTRLDGFLDSKGSSLDELNSYISSSVEENGYGTRNGVVPAAVSMINYLYDNFDTRLPYWWGGGHGAPLSQCCGLDGSVGGYKVSPEIKNTGVHTYYYSFDCSGFVSWAIRNGGYNFSTRTAQGFINSFGKDSCQLSSKSCTGLPGDLIANSGHVQMIVGLNEEKGTYWIAESAGKGVVISEKSMHFGGNTLLHMGEYYSNSKNIRSK